MSGHLERFNAATAATRQRALTLAAFAWDASLLECLDLHRPFEFLRTVDNVERVAIRSFWETRQRAAWAQDAIARYRAIPRYPVGSIIDTEG